MFGLICLSLAVISIVTVYFVLLYRVHVHITYTPIYGGKSRSRYPRGKGTARSGDDSPHQFPVATPRLTGKNPREVNANRPPRVSDIRSALVNLGCDRERARQVAETVCSQAPAADIETLIRMALQEVQRAA